MSAPRIIMFIATMIVVALAVGVISQTMQNTRSDVQQEVIEEPTISQVELYGIQDGQAQYVRFYIDAGSKHAVDDMAVSIRTDETTQTTQIQ